MFAGVTAPILVVAALLVVFVMGGGGGDDLSGPQPPRSDVAGVCVNATPVAGAASDCASTVSPTGLAVSTATPVPPTPTPAPRTYIVRAGDSLSVICAAEAPQMSLDVCVDAIVDLSDLGGPDEIAEGQSLRLPPVASTPIGTTSTTSDRGASAATPTPSAVEPEPTEEVASEPEATEEPTEEPQPTPYASLVALGPSDADDDEETLEPEPTTEVTDTEEGTTPTDEELAASRGVEYTVQAGDSLLGICVDQVPDMPEDECIEFIVLLNDLGGPDEITAGQVLILP